MIQAIIMLLISIYSFRATGQSSEVTQLLLNVEKLAQLKQILTDLKKGYDIVNTGYNTVKDLSQGNFSLHKTFLDGLLGVSPAVRNYKRVADIISYQLLIVREQQQALARFRTSGGFSANELAYIGTVYDRLGKESLKNLDDLLNVVTAAKMRMNDQERLEAIDRIFVEMEGKLHFLRSFNASTSMLALQREQAQKEIQTSRIFQGIK